jgi:hypothetical protein
VTLRARWVTLRARWVTLRARWVTRRARWVTLRAHWVTLRARWVTFRWVVRWVAGAADDDTRPAREERGAGVLALGCDGQPYVLQPGSVSLLLSEHRLRALGPTHPAGRHGETHGAEWRPRGAGAGERGPCWLPGLGPAAWWAPALLDHVLVFQGLEAAQRLRRLNGWPCGAVLRVRQVGRLNRPAREPRVHSNNRLLGFAVPIVVWTRL